MEAKDTVKDFNLVLLYYHKVDIDRFLKEQAELSYQAGIKEGRKEVVEFIVHKISIKTDDNGIFISGYIAGEKWQDKLKEWGI